jgi:hypothetical protein
MLLGTAASTNARAGSLRRRRFAAIAAALVPALVVFFASARFVWNHFYADGPYLLDAGFLSGVVYRRGIVPYDLPIENAAPSYFSIHVSPLVSLASVISYVVPLPRVEYFCAVNGLLYATLAAAPALLVRPRTIRGALAVGIAALAFAFGGQVLVVMGYPHYEIFVAAGVVTMLAGAATGRAPLAWAGLAMAAATREDGGGHVALFALAVLACGRSFRLERRTTLALVGAGVLASVAAVLLERVFFGPSDLFGSEYLGHPAYAHIDASVVSRRAVVIVERGRFITYPFVATVALAIARRDARYLFGWAAAFPWFVLNFFAAQELKSAFEIYTGFPFVASTFWVAAYGVSVRARFPLAALAAVSVVATLGFAMSLPEAFAHISRASFVRGQSNPEGLRAIAGRLRKDPRAYGKVFVEGGVASWALESTAPDDLLQSNETPAAIRQHDGVIFFRSWISTPQVDALLAKAPYPRCGRLKDSIVHLCVRAERQLPAEFEPEGPPVPPAAIARQ